MELRDENSTGEWILVSRTWFRDFIWFLYLRWWLYRLLSFPSPLFNFTNIILSSKSNNSITVSNILWFSSSGKNSLLRPQPKNSPDLIANGITKFTNTLIRKIFDQILGIDWHRKGEDRKRVTPSAYYRPSSCNLESEHFFRTGWLIAQYGRYHKGRTPDLTR